MEDLIEDTTGEALPGDRDGRGAVGLGIGASIAGAAITLTLLCLGLAAVAACVIIPQADANRQLAYERDKLLADLHQIDAQAAVNEAFLKNIESNPQLAQRLAQRQMKLIRQGESLLPMKAKPAGNGYSGETGAIAAEVSPFTLVHLSPPPPAPPYQPAGGLVGHWLLDSHIRLYCLAGGMFLVAMSLVLSSNASEPSDGYPADPDPESAAVASLRSPDFRLAANLGH